MTFWICAVCRREQDYQAVRWYIQKWQGSRWLVSEEKCDECYEGRDK